MRPPGMLLEQLQCGGVFCKYTLRKRLELNLIILKVIFQWLITKEFAEIFCLFFYAIAQISAEMHLPKSSNSVLQRLYNDDQFEEAL